MSRNFDVIISKVGKWGRECVHQIIILQANRFESSCLPECNEKLSRSDLFHVSSFHLNHANVHEFSKTVRDYSTIFVIAANIEWKLQANYIVNIAPNPLDWSSIRERAQNLWKHFFLLQSEHILISVSELKLIKR